MNLWLRAKLLTLSGVLALGGLTTAAPAAHAFPDTLPPRFQSPFHEHIGVSPGDPDCNSLTVWGGGFYGHVLLVLYEGGTSATGGGLLPDASWGSGWPLSTDPKGSDGLISTNTSTPVFPQNGSTWTATAYDTATGVTVAASVMTCSVAASTQLSPSSGQPMGGGGAPGHEPVVNPHKPNLQ